MSHYNNNNNNSKNHNHSSNMSSTHSYNWYKLYEHHNNPVPEDVRFHWRPAADTVSLQPPQPPTAANGNNCQTAAAAAASLARMRVLYDYRAPAGSRWSPTAQQLQELQALFHMGGLRTPTTAQISRITARLRRHGRIEGRNVFYWFQNQKARERKHRSMSAASSALKAPQAAMDQEEAAVTLKAPQADQDQDLDLQTRSSIPVPAAAPPKKKKTQTQTQTQTQTSLGFHDPCPAIHHHTVSALPLDEINPPNLEMVQQAPSILHSAAGPGEIENANVHPSAGPNESVDPNTSSISKSNSSPYSMHCLYDDLVVDDHEMSPTLQLQRYNHHQIVSKPVALMQLFPLSPLNVDPHDQLVMKCNTFNDVVMQPYIDHLQSYTTSPTTTASSSSNSNGWSEALMSSHVAASKSTSLCNPNWLDLKLAMNY